jgi:hypothetical protein
MVCFIHWFLCIDLHHSLLQRKTLDLLVRRLQQLPTVSVRQFCQTVLMVNLPHIRMVVIACVKVRGEEYVVFSKIM